MNPTLRKDADAIIASSLNAVLPDEAVRRALKAFAPKGGRVLLVAAGGEKLKLLLRTRTWYHRQPAPLGQKLWQTPKCPKPVIFP